MHHRRVVTWFLILSFLGDWSPVRSADLPPASQPLGLYQLREIAASVDQFMRVQWTTQRSPISPASGETGNYRVVPTDARGRVISIPKCPLPEMESVFEKIHGSRYATNEHAVSAIRKLHVLTQGALSFRLKSSISSMGRELARLRPQLKTIQQTQEFLWGARLHVEEVPSITGQSEAFDLVLRDVHGKKVNFKQIPDAETARYVKLFEGRYPTGQNTPNKFPFGQVSSTLQQRRADRLTDHLHADHLERIRLISSKIEANAKGMRALAVAQKQSMARYQEFMKPLREPATSRQSAQSSAQVGPEPGPPARGRTDLLRLGRPTYQRLARRGGVDGVVGTAGAVLGTAVAVSLIEQARERGVSRLDLREAVSSTWNWGSLRSMLGAVGGGATLGAVAGSLVGPGMIGVLIKLTAAVVGATLGGQLGSGHMPDLSRLPATTLGNVAGTGIGMLGGPVGMFAGSIAGMYFGEWLADRMVAPRPPSQHPIDEAPQALMRRTGTADENTVTNNSIDMSDLRRR